LPDPDDPLEEELGLDGVAPPAADAAPLALDAAPPAAEAAPLAVEAALPAVELAGPFDFPPPRAEKIWPRAWARPTPCGWLPLEPPPLAPPPEAEFGFDPAAGGGGEALGAWLLTSVAAPGLELGASLQAEVLGPGMPGGAPPGSGTHAPGLDGSVVLTPGWLGPSQE
jgi:hypothetical protein